MRQTAAGQKRGVVQGDGRMRQTGIVAVVALVAAGLMPAAPRRVMQGRRRSMAYEGVLYAVNGANDVFAFDVETGTIRWRYEGKPDTRAGSPMGRASRGVALGDGRVYLGIADGRLTALDQAQWAAAVAGTGRTLSGKLRHHRRAGLDLLHRTGTGRVRPRHLAQGLGCLDARPWSCSMQPTVESSARRWCRSARPAGPTSSIA